MAEIGGKGGGKPSRAFDFGVFSLVTFFGRAKKVTKAKDSNTLIFVLDKPDPQFRIQITNYFFRLKSFTAFLSFDALTRWNVFNPSP